MNPSRPCHNLKPSASKPQLTSLTSYLLKMWLQKVCTAEPISICDTYGGWAWIFTTCFTTKPTTNTSPQVPSLAVQLSHLKSRSTFLSTDWHVVALLFLIGRVAPFRPRFYFFSHAEVYLLSQPHAVQEPKLHLDCNTGAVCSSFWTLRVLYRSSLYSSFFCKDLSH
ncbi:hypothetical protein K402DRAFT_189677 [Aulographum hederae CBS 113979]|uniref:Uncharacterized protein n=1 Tax=Aulographum hederae CBS 113979 TaxID=1176131 RepID=A0A6G1GPM9_9PEZI|nr:hypothetical protein K402DRAFT_189677 [Aulographum hederae CBS 113979]